MAALRNPVDFPCINFICPDLKCSQYADAGAKADIAATKGVMVAPEPLKATTSMAIKSDLSLSLATDRQQAQSQQADSSAHTAVMPHAVASVCFVLCFMLNVTDMKLPHKQLQAGYTGL